jgi:DNA mismatch repair ATPase MutS
MQLSKLFSPITNGGKRLLKANLLQPFSTIDNIQLRNEIVSTMFNTTDDDTINPLK